jgi:hypothetical protein
LKRKINGVVKHRWVCAECVAKHHPPLITKYTYDASTGKFIEPHLEIHRICNPDGPSKPARDGKQLAITQYLGIDDVDPRNQAIAAKFAELVNPEILNIRFMNLLVVSDLPFRVIDNKAFRSLMAVINPEITLPSHQSVARLVSKEFHGALPAVRGVLQSALRLIHFTFDGWTSRQNNSSLVIHAHFLDNS